MIKECFWILAHLIEELMPADYYTNMLPLRADILIVTKILAMKDKKLMDHFEKVYMDLSILMVESFLTLFTNTCHPRLVDIIIDHFLIDGPVVLIKTMVLFMLYLKEKLMQMDSFFMMVNLCKHEMKSPTFVDPLLFSNDLMNFFLSKYWINKLRDYYTGQERERFAPPKNLSISKCESDWPICYKALDTHKGKLDNDRQLTFRSHFVMGNFKFDYFNNKRLEEGFEAKHKATRIKTKHTIIPEHDLLIERQGHVCDCCNAELERMKSEIKDLISMQISNYSNFKIAQASKESPQVSPQVKEIFDKHTVGAIREEDEEEGSEWSESPGTPLKNLASIGGTQLFEAVKQSSHETPKRYLPCDAERSSSIERRIAGKVY